MRIATHKARLASILTFALLGFLIVLFSPDSCLPGIDELALPARSVGALAFYADIYQFEGANGKTRAEICYNLDLKQLYALSTQHQAAVLFIDLALSSGAGENLAHLHERKALALTRELAQQNYAFVDLKKFVLAPGDAIFELAIRDSVSNQAGTLKKSFAVREFERKLSLSDLILSSQILKAQGKSSFEKGGLIVVPNPARAFLAEDSSSHLFVYFEINNLYYDSQKPAAYRLNLAVHNAQKQEIFSTSRTNAAKATGSGARLERIPLAKLAVGRHRLTLRLTDLATHDSCNAQIDFVYGVNQSEAEMILPMSETDVQKYFDQIKYLATAQEQKLYWQLSAVGKQQFLLEFWKGKDPTPATPENEFMIEYFRRVAHCEQKFAGKLTCDMAKIYLKYGPPMEVVREAASFKVNRPVEVWTYALDGKREFVFVDRIGDGNYVLVHSNHVDEFNNPNWADDFRH
ncbi:MAG: GWxTD domain-containing protein [bacterium]